MLTSLSHLIYPHLNASDWQYTIIRTWYITHKTSMLTMNKLANIDSRVCVLARVPNGLETNAHIWRQSLMVPPKKLWNKLWSLSSSVKKMQRGWHSHSLLVQGKLEEALWKAFRLLKFILSFTGINPKEIMRKIQTFMPKTIHRRFTYNCGNLKTTEMYNRKNWLRWQWYSYDRTLETGVWPSS